jgi:hypothetical protein
MKSLLKIYAAAALLFVTVFSALPAEAYVNVKGYYRSNGTYVQPHVRSNPNGLKYDNYSYKPSQGLYNPTYGTRGTTWDTPTWITDPNYYEGKTLYEQQQTGLKSIGSGSSIPSVTPTVPSLRSIYQPKATQLTVPLNAHLDWAGTNWICDSGYKKVGSSCQAVIVPLNAHLDWTGSNWTCDSGYRKSGSGCESVLIPSNAHLDWTGSNWTCDSGYRKLGGGCQVVVIPPNGHLDWTGSNWTCDSGFRKVGSVCEEVLIPLNAHLDWTGSAWTCDSGYRRIGSSCQMVIVPANGHLDWTGSNWVCDSGYQKAGNTCL